MIPASSHFDQSTITALLHHDPLVQRYRTFFSFLDWSVVEEWQQRRSSRGRPVEQPISASLKIFLLRIQEGLIYTQQLRKFLLEHPLLMIDFGFDLVLDSHAPYGFDAEKTLPSRQWIGEKLRALDRSLLQGLLASTVTALVQEIPGLGETVAFNVKHIYAWVKENNPRVFTEKGHDKHHRPTGDPDCRLGVKRSTNQEQPDGSTKEKKEVLWGYGSGVAAATTPTYGDVVLAEYTLPFNEGDVTYFEPLYRQTVAALGIFPTNITADAAYDAWYVYQKAALHGGIAAIPLNAHTTHASSRATDGVPLCEKGLRMVPTFQFAHTNGYQAQRFRCPLLHPQPDGQTCEHPQFVKGKGCVKDLNWELGGLQRVLLDRTTPLYRALANQRTSCERINSQAKELGIERPKVRNAQSVKNLNTLTYIVINVRALNRAKSINRRLLQMN
ncbi:transposase [Tengunoibacter tsumagoiensis]|uniref:Uncharacterized protein n=1 Tax=Tengunoibacter tsumagoiensis TaxID=2014871 RepID=A0A402A9A3_9CHLR|nr:transposase [Tengunoibacter tsumagoiensis]GCE15709.1 hypothetical protein KTT_55680 [Tengunoibacter tsumagoiensis]